MASGYPFYRPEPHNCICCPSLRQSNRADDQRSRLRAKPRDPPPRYPAGIPTPSSSGPEWMSSRRSSPTPSISSMTSSLPEGSSLFSNNSGVFSGTNSPRRYCFSVNPEWASETKKNGENKVRLETSLRDSARRNCRRQVKNNAVHNLPKRRSSSVPPTYRRPEDIITWAPTAHVDLDPSTR